MAVTVPTTSQRVLDVARRELGVHENPFGSNKTKYGEWYGMNGVAWCNIFVTWVLHHAGASNIPKYAYTPSSSDWFKSKGAWIPKTSRPKAGDLIWFDFPNDNVNRISHIGIVEGVLADGRIATIEGNTNGAGGRTGGMVMRHNRSVSGGIVGYGSIDYKVGTQVPTTQEDDMPKSFIAAAHDNPADKYLVRGDYSSKWMIPSQEVLDGLKWLDSQATTTNKFLQDHNVHTLGLAFIEAIPTEG